MKRLLSFSLGEIYHICNKSIASYEIYRNEEFSKRFLDICAYYNRPQPYSYSMYIRKNRSYSYKNVIQLDNSNFPILAYCIMPDHYHLLVRLNTDSNLSGFIGTVENSFSRYYNERNNRKGPLWQSRFRSTRILSNEQLLHVTRYIHLNPVTAAYVTDPKYWPFSSYRLYLQQGILDELKLISIRSASSYELFVLNNVEYQKKIRVIRKQLRDY